MEAYKPRRLRIMDPGLDNYTGPIGPIDFVDGVSVDAIDWIEAGRLGANLHVEDADREGHQINEAAEILRSRELNADDDRVVKFNQSFQLDGETKIGIEHLSREELEAIADKDGLAGVRELARKWGGTGRSINECIEAVLRGQANAQSENQPEQA